MPVYAKSAIMRAGVARGTGRGGVLASKPSSNTGLHAASHIRCKMVGEATADGLVVRGDLCLGC